MAILNRLTDRTILIISTILLVLSVGLFLGFKFNTGVDLMDATVFVAQLDHEEKLATVITNAEQIQSPSRVEKESTGKFYLYYQSLSSEQLANIKEGFSKVQPGVLSLETFYYTPAREYFLKNRVILISGFISLIGLVYLLYIFKGLKLKRSQVLTLVVTEVVLLLFGMIVILGLNSLFGKFGVVMDNSFFTFTLGAFMTLVLFSIYSLIRIRDLLLLEKFDKIIGLFTRLKNKYWPEAVFIFSTGVLVMVLPWMVISKSVALSAFQLVWALLISLYVFFYLRPAVSRSLMTTTATIKKITASSFWQKQW